MTAPSGQRGRTAAVPSAMSLMRGPLFWGLIIVFGFFGIFGGWAAFAPLNSGTVAPGVVNVKVNTVSHFEGGMVAEIHVRENQTIKAGDPLVTLESTKAEAAFRADNQQLLRLLVTKARQDAHIKGLSAMVLPAAVRDIADAEFVEYIDNERRQFETERRDLQGKVEISERRIAQLESEIQALEAQRNGQQRQKQLIDDDIANSEQLLAQQLVARTVISAQLRQQADLEIAMAGTEADIARAYQTIEETRLSLLQTEEAFRLKISAESAQTNNEIAVRSVNVTASGDVLRRTAVTSPIDGTVQNIRDYTIGGVVGSGQAIMDVVPVDQDFTIIARVAIKDIDLVHENLSARVVLVPFANRNEAPLAGTVTDVPPNITTEKETGISYYAVRVSVPSSELAKHEDMYMTSGMGADVTVVTGSRTMLQYLVEPFARAVNLAFTAE